MSIELRLVALEKRVRSAEDRLEIIQLLSSYGPAVDSGSCAEAAALWLEGGVYDVGGRFRAVGRSAISALYEADAHQQLIHQGSSHLTATPWIKIDNDEAEAVAYSFVVLKGEDDWGLWRASANHWKLKRTENGWKIVERFNRVLDGSPESHETLRRAVS